MTVRRINAEFCKRLFGLALLPFCAVALLLCSCRDTSGVPAKFRRATEAGARKSAVALKIDYHAHVSTMSFERALRIMDRNGIAMTVNLTPGFPGGGFETAQVMAHLTGDRIVNFVNLDWEHVEDPGMLDRDPVPRPYCEL